MPGLITVSLKNARQFTAASHSGADYIELRTDYFSIAQIMNLAQRSRLPIILTVKRAMTLPSVLPHSVKYIDFDYKAPQTKLRRVPHGLNIIQSFHDYTATPTYTKLAALVKRAHQHGYLPKIATTIRTVDDLAVIARLQKTYGKRIIAIGMGELGIMTRLYNKSLLTFAALTQRSITASGQLTVTQLRSGMQLYGLIGETIAHSLSPRLHNTWFKQQYLPHRYQLWSTQDLDKFMSVFNFFGLPGASVTMPYKKDIMSYCATLDRHAKTIGAVNTLVRRGNKLIGYNTDWLGVQRALGQSLRQARVLILGSGGAAAAIAYAAKQTHAKTVVSLHRADLPTQRTNFDVVINATPVHNALLVSASALKHKVVMDCIYDRSTQLQRSARKHHARRIVNGLPMLRIQAAEQFKVWTRKSV